jgi:hypothetical protein
LSLCVYGVFMRIATFDYCRKLIILKQTKDKATSVL